ncbi:MAG: phosphoglucomutase [Bacteroidetes bacterium GWF2_43_63]|nr:MAG: phosphoglucomutase [Bacteroidetes bacterium GWE2_42_42]OFY53397.1 MAG: phosphoglucomutase [Bacteroidetes bacterium GWF2_43_63]HBG69432.1 phosphomannomutase/phosphoglucomutase [Bacteroidales bacterium]HCB62051.1 phosphomannomutase/phosphoglucomutase [Bacteroidales bacterium]HCY23113.1 phosphomannomutase/phosphoglucomutase [Bacteroidales bacterium]
MGAFHAYDIRGVYGKDFNAEDVYRMGFFLPSIMNAKRWLVGRDVRESSPEIHRQLLKGLTDAGCEVSDAGLCTTPMVYWGTAKFGFDASVMITASHNPSEYNGLKISAANAVPVGYDNGLNKLEQKIKEIPEVTVTPGKVIELDFLKDYVAFMMPYKKDISNLKIVMDCSNGMASLMVKDIFGSHPVYLFDELDGRFPNHEPNPLDMKNIIQLQQKVKETGADLGVIFDGDADRVMFTDENGTFIPPDLLIGLLGHYFLEEKGLKGKVIQDIRTSKSVAEYLAPLGAEMKIWRVGRAYAANMLREIDGIYGGELAGHYYFKDFYYSDSGILASILIINLFAQFKREGISASAVVGRICKYQNSGEINFRIAEKQKAMDAVKDHFFAQASPTLFLDFDGYRVEYPDWWFNIRPSNTEPYLRLLVEAKTAELLQEKTETINKILANFQS